MFASQRPGYYVKLVESYNVIEGPGASEIRNGSYIIDWQRIVLNRLNIVYRIPRPGLFNQRFSRHQCDVPARILRFFEKLIPFVLAGYASDVLLHFGFDFELKEWHNLSGLTTNFSIQKYG